MEDDEQSGIGACMLGAGSDWNEPACETTSKIEEQLSRLEELYDSKYHECIAAWRFLEEAVACLRMIMSLGDEYTGPCCCDFAIGHPSYTDHSSRCKRGREVLEKMSFVLQIGGGDVRRD